MNDTLLIVAMVAALGMLGVVVTIGVMIAPQAEAAGCENGQAASLAFNASKGRCFGH